MKVSKPNNDFFLEQATLNDPRFTKFEILEIGFR